MLLFLKHRRDITTTDGGTQAFLSLQLTDPESGTPKLDKRIQTDLRLDGTSSEPTRAKARAQALHAVMVAMASELRWVARRANIEGADARLEAKIKALRRRC